MTKTAQEKVAEIYETTKWSQERIARELEATKKSVAFWLSGERVPRQRRLIRAIDELHEQVTARALGQPDPSVRRRDRLKAAIEHLSDDSIRRFYPLVMTQMAQDLAEEGYAPEGILTPADDGDD